MALNSLKPKLVGLLSLLSVFFLGLFTIVAFEMSKTIQKETQAKARHEAERVLASVDREISRVYVEGLSLSKSEAVRGGLPAKMTALMNETVHHSSIPYSLIMAVDLKGKVVAINTVSREGESLDISPSQKVNFAEEAWFEAASRETEPGIAITEDPTKDSLVSEIYEEEMPTMRLTFPIRNADGSRVLGLWTVLIDWSAFVKNAIGSLTFAKNEGLRSVTITNEEGLFLFNPRKENFELEKTDPAFKAKTAFFERNSDAFYVQKEKVSFENRGRVFIEASAKSSGFGEYAGMGWVSTVQMRTSNSYLKTIIASAFCALVLTGAALLVLLTMIRENGSAGHYQTAPSSAYATAAPVVRVESSFANEIGEASKALAQAMGEQATLLQQTSTQMGDLNSLVNRTLDAANLVVDMTNRSKDYVQREKDMVEEMVQAVDRIQSHQNTILTQLGKSNERLASVANIVAILREKVQKSKDNVIQIRKDSNSTNSNANHHDSHVG